MNTTAYDSLAACEQIAQAADELGRQACVDPVLHVVLTECPACHAERGDPLGLFLPMKIVPRHDVTVMRCQACGYERSDQRGRRRAEARR